MTKFEGFFFFSSEIVWQNFIFFFFSEIDKISFFFFFTKFYLFCDLFMKFYFLTFPLWNLLQFLYRILILLNSFEEICIFFLFHKVSIFSANFWWNLYFLRFFNKISVFSQSFDEMHVSAIFWCNWRFFLQMIDIIDFFQWLSVEIPNIFHVWLLRLEITFKNLTKCLKFLENSEHITPGEMLDDFLLKWITI